ncbi:MAG: hypothetical protein VKK99_06030 [Cyanobacteriota bacterium]|nr:hypothetical protein [Cyanobacteriota bacterium]
MFLVSRASLVLLLLTLSGLTGLAQSVDLEACRSLRSQRDDLASHAMEQEITLVRSVRGKICPHLAAKAEAANARDQAYGPLDSFDFAAWSHCRQEAEDRLAHSRPIRFRNQQGFVFYTPQGARFAAKADRLSAVLRVSACP